MRTPVVAGNWKMNPPTLAEALELARSVLEVADQLDGVTTVICPPTVWLADLHRAVSGGPLALGAQTMHHEEGGAFTGETSPVMLAQLATFVIVGHSERRQYDGETDEAVSLKVASAVAHGLRPVAAVGERADERRAGQTAAVIDRQVRAAVSRLDHLLGSGLVIAYEPVWAIGTRDPASPDDAQTAAAQIRSILRQADPAGSDEIPIQYGGSVSAENAAAFFAQPDVDGALVGGASLKSEEFAAILRAAASTADAKA